MGGGYGQSDLPRVGLGFLGQQQGGFAAQSEDTVNMSDFGGFIEFDVGRKRMRVWVNYGEGDASNGFNFPASNQVQYGGVYTAPSPSGISGVQLQQLGMEGQTRVELRSFSAGGEFSIVDLSPLEAARRHHPGDSIFCFLDFARRESEYVGTISSSATFSNSNFFFNQQRVQQLDENHFGAGLGFRFGARFDRSLTGHFSGRAGAYYRWSELDSVERVTSNVTPSQDREFTIEIQDSDDGVGLKGKLGAALEFLLSPNVSVFVGGSVDYQSDIGAIFNPRSSSELLNEGLTTGTRTGDVWSWRAGIGVTVRFGDQ